MVLTLRKARNNVSLIGNALFVVTLAHVTNSVCLIRWPKTHESLSVSEFSLIGENVPPVFSQP